MATVATPESNTDTSLQRLERAFLVRRREVERGLMPAAEPIVLVDTAHAFKFVGIRRLELVDPPAMTSATRLGHDCTPLFAISWREAPAFENARPATIVRDSRSGEPDVPKRGAPDSPLSQGC